MIEFFKPVDFMNHLKMITTNVGTKGNEYFVNTISLEDAAEIANAKLNSALGPKVYQWNDGTDKAEEWGDAWHTTDEDEPGFQADRIAYIFNIQPNPDKKPCEHYPRVKHLEIEGITDKHTEYKCGGCGQKLKAIWSVE